MNSTHDTRADYRYFHAQTTRWADNDAYGHINNVAYYGFFDTAVNGWLIANHLLDIAHSPAVGLVVETGCRYFSPLHYPQAIEVAIRVAKIGKSSVRYELAVFGQDSPLAAAQGFFVHVYVDRINRRPVPIPDAVRAALASLINTG
jgi:acyl-CoA thioester hydrolase